MRIDEQDTQKCWNYRKKREQLETILRQDSTRCALTIPGSCNYIFFFFFIPLVNQVPSRSHAVHKLTTWITGRDISKVTSSLATMLREAMGLATEALITTSGPGEPRAGEKERRIQSTVE